MESNSQNVVQMLQEKGEKLYNLRKVIGDIEDRHEAELGTLKQQRDMLQDELLEDFKRIGLFSIKLASGTTVVRAVRKGVEVTSEAMAFSWAYANRAVRIDTRLIAQKLEDALKTGAELPAGFQAKEIDYISVRNVDTKTAEPAL